MRLRSGIACQEMVELVTDYLEGGLSWRERRRFERHIASPQPETKEQSQSYTLESFTRSRMMPFCP